MNYPKSCCNKPEELVVDHKTELYKHRHNVRTILKYSNATPFAAYCIDEGFACSFCYKTFQFAAHLKKHTIVQYFNQIDTFKEKSTSIFTYVVKLDVTDLCCKICLAYMKTLEDFMEHLLTHDLNIYKDIKNQIVCFKLDTNTLCCMYCGHEFTNFKFLLDHMNEHYKNYICQDCNAGFINYRMLVAHAEGEDLTVGEVKCPLCDEIFDKYVKYQHHEIVAHAGFNLSTHRCPHCQEHFNSDERLREHVVSKHDGRHEYHCAECKKTFGYRKALIEHARKNHFQDMMVKKCDICNIESYTPQQLKDHMARHHDQTPKLQCDLCGKTFACKKTLARHIDTHQMKGKYKCLLCDESFARLSLLNHHVKIDHLNDKLVKCNDCEKMVYQSQLEKHTILRHSAKPYQCGVCYAEFPYKLALIEHTNTYPDHKPQEKKYECRACGKMFLKKIYVKKHVTRVHLLEKKFVCDHCGKQFADCTTLKNHMAQHGPGPAFQCFACPRMFKTKKTMLNHARNHMEDKKVKCEICHHEFIYPYLLRDHKKQVHKLDKSKSSITKKSRRKDEVKVRKKKVITVTEPKEKKLRVVFKKSELGKHQVNIRNILLCSNASPIRRYGGVGYMCCFCPLQFADAALLKAHTLQTHDDSAKNTFMRSQTLPGFVVKLDITDLHCTLCQQPFPNLDDLTSHISVQHGRTFYTDVKSHILPFKFDSDLPRCVVCSHQYNNFKVLLQHMNMHFRNHVCEICGRGFVNKKVFQTHMYRHNTGVFNCSYCDKVFDTRIKKRDHERATHVLMNKRNKCGYCGEKFSDYTKKNDHEVKTHGAKPIVLHCLACNKTFDNQRSLTVHTKYHHLMQKRAPKH